MVWALVALAALIILGLVLAVRYYGSQVSQVKSEASVSLDDAQTRASQAELDRARRDAERYRLAQERAKHAKLSEALRDWRAAVERVSSLHSDRDGDQGGPKAGSSGAL